MEGDQYQDIVAKYKQRVKEEFGADTSGPSPKITSREYEDFKGELYPAHYSAYEKGCNAVDKILKLKSDPKKSQQMLTDLAICHLNVTPGGVMGLAIVTGFAVIFGGLLISAIPSLILMQPLIPLYLFSIIAGIVVIPTMLKIPGFMANTWRMKSSNQMVQSIFYIVTYMRHTSNIERAIEFSANHLEPPLSMDFRKILWDVETQQYSNIRDSANAYLDTWKDSQKEFVESFHLIESSLFEGSEDRRLGLLDKSLEVILNGTYENMMRYAHQLKGPMTMLHMLGVILPILGLVILPLVVSFMSSSSPPLVLAIYIALLYNVTLPAGVYYLGRTILSKRPAGYGAVDITKKKGMKKFATVQIPTGKNSSISISPLLVAGGVFAILILIGFFPIYMHALDPEFDIPARTHEDYDIAAFKLMDYVCKPCPGDGSGTAETCGNECTMENRVGPYGMLASLLSLIVTASFGIGVGLYYKLRSKNVIAIREKSKKLEEEFSSALFQLGNRLSDGIPAEIAFAKVGSTMHGTTAGDFFNLATRNITSLGMGLEQAVFDEKVGAMVNFPSKVIESSMKVLVESSKKGPRIAAQALISMSSYMKEIHRVEERLKDLMADIVSSMRAQVKFMLPAIAGIVIGITSMIATILTKLSGQIGELAGGGDGGGGGISGIVSIFGIGIPTFHFQIVVGLYIAQIAYILTVLSNGVENGADKLGERYALSKNMIRSVLMFCAIAGVVMVLFNMFAGAIIQNALAG